MNILDFRKFPLVHASLPFLAGILFSYYVKWPVSACLLTALFVLLTGSIVYRIYSSRTGKQVMRIVLLAHVWFSAGLVLFALNDFRKDAANIITQTGNEILVSGEIREVKLGIGGRQQLLLETEMLCTGDSVREIAGKILVMVSDDRAAFRCGDLIVTGGKLAGIESKGNPGEFDAVGFYASRKVSGQLFTESEMIERTGHRRSLNAILTDWRDFLSGKMEEELDGTFLAIAKALILGDKSDLDTETMEVFSSTGSMHVLAVSGLHIGLILILLQRILKLFSRWITKRQSIIIAIVLIWIYGGITGASPAVMRAVVMFTALSGAQLLNRQPNSLNVLAFSAIMLLEFDPWMLFDLGFQLSYAALIGIFLLYRPIVDVWVPVYKWTRMGWEGTAAGLAATILTTPLILLWFYRFPNYFALANLGVMVFGFAVLMMGIIFLFTVWIPFLVKLVAVLFAFSVFGLVFWVDWVDSLPGAVSGGFQLPVWQVLVAYVLIGFWIFHLHTSVVKRGWLIIATLLLVGLWTFQRWGVLESRELVVFNSNQFVAAFKDGNRVYGFYDKKWTGSWKVPRELDAFAKYTGSHLQVIPLYGDQTTITMGGKSWCFRKKKEGIQILSPEDNWFYRTNGIPEATENRSLMTTRLQLYADPDEPAKPFLKNYGSSSR